MFVVEGRNSAKLGTRLFWSFRGDYWVIDLSDDYSYAVAGMPSWEYCWILSRAPTMEEHTDTGILERVKAKGFDVTRFNRMLHDSK